MQNDSGTLTEVNRFKYTNEEGESYEFQALPEQSLEIQDQVVKNVSRMIYTRKDQPEENVTLNWEEIVGYDMWIKILVDGLKMQRYFNELRYRTVNILNR